MKRGLLFFSVICVSFSMSGARAQTDDEVTARKTVLDLAGAFSNDGFKVRDGHWSGMVKPHETKIVAVNLYAGNQYWFSVGATTKAKKISVEVYDERGERVVTEKYEAGEKAAAGFSAGHSGQYYVSLGLIEGEPTSFCLVYSYK